VSINSNFLFLLESLTELSAVIVIYKKIVLTFVLLYDSKMNIFLVTVVS